MSHVTRLAIAVAAMLVTLAGCRDVARQLAPDATISRSIDPMMSQITEEASAPLVFRTVAPQATGQAEGMRVEHETGITVRLAREHSITGNSRSS